MPQSKLAPRSVAATLKEEQCIQLRAAGLNFKQIAEAVGYSDSGGAYKATQKAIARHRANPETVEQLRVISSLRYDDLYRRASEALVRPHYVVSGGKVVEYAQENRDGTVTVMPLIDDTATLRAIETMLHVEERRAAMFGLDAARKYDLTGQVEVTVDVKEAVKARAEHLRARQAGTIPAIALLAVGGAETRN